jgi:hypothetical protein
MRHEFTIPDFLPHTLNELIGVHWGTRSRRKREDRLLIGAYAKLAGIPLAACKRRVAVTLTLAPRQRGADPDAFQKSLGDAMVCAGLLVDDGPRWVEWLPVRYERGPRRATRIEMEDVEQ